MRIREIISEARAHLEMVNRGLEQLGGEPSQRLIGLRNIAIFGRMVTFATNNLRSQIDAYEALDKDLKVSCFDNPESRYFYKLRNIIEKEARTPTSTVTLVHALNLDDLQKMAGPPPKNATAFFVGDQSGGSGWNIKTAGGREEKFYVQLPLENVESFVTLPDFDENKDAVSVAEVYVKSLQNYFAEVLKITGE